MQAHSIESEATHKTSRLRGQYSVYGVRLVSALLQYCDSVGGKFEFVGDGLAGEQIYI